MPVQQIAGVGVLAVASPQAENGGRCFLPNPGVHGYKHTGTVRPGAFSPQPLLLLRYYWLAYVYQEYLVITFKYLLSNYGK